MTRLYIDKREILPIPSDLHSLDQVLKLVESNHLQGDMAVRQVQVDGVPLFQDDRKAAFQENISYGGTIEVFTATLREVAVESIGEAVTYLERAQAAIPSLSLSLRGQAEPEASSNLRQFYEGMYFIHLLLQKLEQAFQVPFADLRVQGGNPQVGCIKMTDLLKQVIEAHEKRDFGLLADLLESQVGPFLPALKEMFENIKSRILIEQ